MKPLFYISALFAVVVGIRTYSTEPAVVTRTVASLDGARYGDDQKIPLFKSSEPLSLTIQGNFPTVNLPNAPQDVPSKGDLTYKGADGKDVHFVIQLEARGGGRAWWCNFAPMRLRIGLKEEDDAVVKDRMKGSIFEHSHRTLRLVTHCLGTQFPAENNNWDNVVMTEHASYQILMAAGLPALDSRLVHAKYLDQAGKPFQEGDLLILENASDMADRFHLKDVDKKNPGDAYGHLDPNDEIPFALGLRLIASETDHGFHSEQNSFFVGAKTDQGFQNVMQIPYDFVYSPTEFPYSSKELHHERGWIKSFAANHADKKDVVVNWLTTILKNRANITAAIDRVPYDPKADKPKQNLIQWTNEFLDDAADYLKNAQ